MNNEDYNYNHKSKEFAKKTLAGDQDLSSKIVRDDGKHGCSNGILQTKQNATQWMPEEAPPIKNKNNDIKTQASARK